VTTRQPRPARSVLRAARIVLATIVIPAQLADCIVPAGYDPQGNPAPPPAPPMVGDKCAVHAITPTPPTINEPNDHGGSR
jgi:hypothetical protein